MYVRPGAPGTGTDNFSIFLRPSDQLLNKNGSRKSGSVENNCELIGVLVPVYHLPYLFDLRRPSKYATLGHFIFFVYIKTLLFQNVIIF